MITTAFVLFIALSECSSSKSNSSAKSKSKSKLFKLPHITGNNYGNNIRFDMPYGTGAITGLIPSNEGTYPLFIWVTGTQMNHWTNDDIIYCNYMANHNFVAVSLDYQLRGVFPLSCGNTDSNLNTQWYGKARNLWDASLQLSALNVLCNHARIDCNKGIVLAGFSQGAQLVSLAGNYGFEQYIRGIYQMGGGYKLYNIVTLTFECLRFAQTSIDASRIRSCVGAYDGYFGVTPVGVYEEQRVITNRCTAGEDTEVVYNCVQSDGSGFYIVRNEEVVTGNAVHCYAYENEDCHANDGSPEFDRGYEPGNLESNRYWSMTANLDWLIGKVY